VICGAGFFAELLIGYLWDGCVGVILAFRTNRSERQIDNEQLATRLYIKGVWRGATF
jgi:hypothetical protein